MTGIWYCISPGQIWVPLHYVRLQRHLSPSQSYCTAVMSVRNHTIPSTPFQSFPTPNLHHYIPTLLTPRIWTSSPWPRIRFAVSVTLSQLSCLFQSRHCSLPHYPRLPLDFQSSSTTSICSHPNLTAQFPLWWLYWPHFQHQCSFFLIGLPLHPSHYCPTLFHPITSALSPHLLLLLTNLNQSPSFI